MKDDPPRPPDAEQPNQDTGDSGDSVSMDNTNKLSADNDGFEAGSELMQNKPAQPPPASPPPPPRQQQRAFPFEKLPAELRNRIYELALTAPHAIEIDLADYTLSSSGKLFNPTCICCDCGPQTYCDYDCDDSPKPCPHRLAPNLLLANKRTYNEGIGILYGHNELYFDYINATHRFLNESCRRPSVRRLVKRMVMNMEEMHWKICRDMVGLELESLAFESSQLETIETRAYQIYTIGYFYFKSIGPEKVESILKLTPITSNATYYSVSPDECERAVRDRVVKLLEDEGSELRASDWV